MPWLLPTRTAPWSVFWAESLAAAIALAAAARVFWRRSTRSGSVAIDAWTAGLFALAFVPLLQAQFGLMAVPSESWLICAYLAALPVTALVARAAHEAAPWRMTDTLWWSLVVAAVLSTVIGVAQWLGTAERFWFMSQSHIPGRVVANVGQPNNLSTLLCWGMVGLWWTWRRGQIAAWLAVSLAAFLLLGVALTGSRAAWPALVLLAAVFVAARGSLGGRRTGVVLVALGAWYLAWVLGLASLADWAGASAPRGLEEQASVGLRPLIWKVALDAVIAHPWAGYGWNQFLAAWTEHAPGRLPWPRLVSYAHSLPLDLLVWNGVLLGSAILIAAVAWLSRQVRAAASAEQWLLLAGLGVVGSHAVLELPHAYSFFVLPAAVMVGTLSTLAPSRHVLLCPLPGLAVACIGMAAVLAAMVRDYGSIEAHHLSRRLYDARIGLATQPPELAPTLVLRAVGDTERVLDAQPVAGMSAEGLRQWRRTLLRHPAASSLIRYAQASVLNGNSGEASWALDALCSLHPRTTCEAAAEEWGRFAAKHAGAAQVAAPRPR